jgi:hypothetical protein
MTKVITRLELIALGFAITQMNIKLAYFTKPPKHAWHHRAPGRAHRGNGIPGVQTHRYAAHWWAW